jgi:cytochrome P450
VNRINPLHDGPEVFAAIQRDVGDLLADVKTVVGERAEQPRNDWTSLFLQLEFDGQRLPEDEVVGNVLLTFGGGVDTTAQLTGWTLYHLGKDPELRERLRDDRSLLKNAFDEFLRFTCPVQGIARTINSDTDLDVIDIERNAKRHLGFGIGPHRCLGSHIARVWWEEMIGAVLDRLPDYVIDDDNVAVYPAGAISGLATMPVTFTPERAD